MNYTKSFVLIIALLAVSPLFAQETVRVMSYNVRNCVGMDGSRFDVDRVAKVVTGANPDIAGIQELDCKTERSSGRDILTELSAGIKQIVTGTVWKQITYDIDRTIVRKDALWKSTKSA